MSDETSFMVVILHPPDFRAALQRTPPGKEAVRAYAAAWRGEVPLPVAPEAMADEALEALWALVERGGADCPIPRLAGVPNAIRSFMVGDVVLLNGEAYWCAPIGWEPLGFTPSVAALEGGWYVCSAAAMRMGSTACLTCGLPGASAHGRGGRCGFTACGGACPASHIPQEVPA